MSGLDIEDKKVGSVMAAHLGDTVTVRYSGYVNRGDALQADVTTTSRSPSENVGVPGVVPPNAVLMFEVELLAIRD